MDSAVLFMHCARAAVGARVRDARQHRKSTPADTRGHSPQTLTGHVLYTKKEDLLLPAPPCSSNDRLNAMRRVTSHIDVRAVGFSTKDTVPSVTGHQIGSEVEWTERGVKWSLIEWCLRFPDGDICGARVGQARPS